MRVSLDSNAWETIFDPADRKCAPIRAALADHRVAGFICESGFRIEAIRRQDRAAYFVQPYMDVRNQGAVVRDGRPFVHWSIGPDDSHHPGLPIEQVGKLKQALAVGVELMRGLNWMGLPAPQGILDPEIYVSETSERRREREQGQLDVSACIDGRGLGKAAFDAAGGWSDRVVTGTRFRMACAEWADGELVAAHVAYRNDVLCTDDFAGHTGKSVFDRSNRSWLAAEFGVAFRTLDELIAEVAQ